MITHQNIYRFLILIILVSFGSFGSLSHLFNLILIIYLLFSTKNITEKVNYSRNSALLFSTLSAAFFIFFIHGLFYSNIKSVFEYSSPMFAIPIIGILIILQNNYSFRITCSELANCAHISVAMATICYLVLHFILDPSYAFSEYQNGRIELFSGNPIPFSIALYGVALFCLCNWHDSNKYERLKALGFLLIGIYLSSILSGVRGNLLLVILNVPILVLYLTGSLIFSCLSIFGILISIATLAFLSLNSIIQVDYLERVIGGMQTLLLFDTQDQSIWFRQQMWMASFEAILNSPLLGYGISGRFNAIVPYLPANVPNFSHPHNDLIASATSVGLVGPIVAFISFTSPIWAALLSPDLRRTKIFFGVIISFNLILSACFQTVFFNDITAAWLAFSTFLIWNLKTLRLK